jgi:predicted dehydrogenase
MSNPLNCAIIGAGSIGGLIDTPKSSNVASHAHAITLHERCLLRAICEPDKTNQEEFKKRWGEMSSYEDSEDLLDEENIDLLVIASPTKFHASNLHQALQADNISHILCEKPLVLTQEELEILKPKLLQSEKKILINLMRRYDPSFIQIANDIAMKKWGKALHFHGVFTKGLLHNGIHALGVLSHFFGEIEDIQNIDTKYKNEDLSGDFHVRFKGTNGLLSCMSDAPYSVFELTIWFEEAKVEIKDGGAKIDIFTKEPSPLYEGYYILKHKERLLNTLEFYALNSLDFLLQNDDMTLRQILKDQIFIHEKIFKTIERVRKNEKTSD